MNQFYFETRGKEKVNEVMEEGMRSQAYYSNNAARARISGRMLKLMLLVMGLLGLLGLLTR